MEEPEADLDLGLETSSPVRGDRKIGVVRDWSEWVTRRDRASKINSMVERHFVVGLLLPSPT